MTNHSAPAKLVTVDHAGLLCVDKDHTSLRHVVHFIQQTTRMTNLFARRLIASRVNVPCDGVFVSCHWS